MVQALQGRFAPPGQQDGRTEALEIKEVFMEQKIGNRGQGVGCRELKIEDRGQGLETRPVLKEIDKLKLERLNLSISNLNLQLALLNERARALQIGMAGLLTERVGLVKGIMESSDYAAGAGNWRLNPDTMTFEATQQEEVKK